MHIHEHQAKALLAKHGVTVPAGMLAKTPAQALAAAKKLKTSTVAVKAQVHAGGRGKAGGIVLCKTPTQVQKAAASLLGKPLTTLQTGPAGQPVNAVYVEAGVDIAREMYLAMLLDRAQSRLVMMAGTQGGVDVVKLAHDSPESLFREVIDPLTGLQPYQARKLAFALGLTGDAAARAERLMLNLYRLYTEKDCSLVEINPLVLTRKGDVLALDGKISFDDHALFRQPEILRLDDPTQHDPRETQAREAGLTFVSLDGGCVGCLANGAGMAMATMDILKLCGAPAASFADIGGGADEAHLTAALKLVPADPRIRVILINIFGGILHGDAIADIIVRAARKAAVKVPLVVRLEGLGAAEGHAILTTSGLPVFSAASLTDAAHMAVRLAARQSTTGPARPAKPKAVARKAAAKKKPAPKAKPAPKTSTRKR